MATAKPNDDLLGVYEPLTEEQCTKVDQLRARLADVLDASSDSAASLPPSYNEWIATHPTLFFARFLYARKWTVDDAEKMIREAAAWRVANELETTPLFPSACCVRRFDQHALQDFQGLGAREPGFVDGVASQFKSTYTSAWHGWDKGGRPIYIERTGQVKPEQFVRRCTALVKPGGDKSEPIFKMHLHTNEVGGQILRYQNEQLEKAGKSKVCQVTVIMDCKDLGMRHFYGPALELLKTNTKMDQQYYAEGMYRLYVANAPTLITVGWSIVKRWVDPRMHKKVFFLKPGEETTKALLEAVDAEVLPKFLGGHCECDGECVPEVLDDHEENDAAATETINVGAGTIAERAVEVKAGATLAWSFVVASHNICFSVVFTNAESGEKSTLFAAAEKAEKISEHEGSHDATATGTVTFKFDNAYSWRTAKEVHFRTETIVIE